jgi:hypothetical protein
MNAKIVQIKIAFMGKRPGPELLSRFQELKRRLIVDDFDMINSNIEEGAAYVRLSTNNPDRPRECAWTHVNGLGLSSRTTVRVKVPEA